MAQTARKLDGRTKEGRAARAGVRAYGAVQLAPRKEVRGLVVSITTGALLDGYCAGTGKSVDTAIRELVMAARKPNAPLPAASSPR
jgi:hypothetical protein